MNSSAEGNKDSEGVVSADSVYTLEEIMKRLKLQQTAMRSARKAGLKVRQIGRRRFILGCDLIEHLKSQPPCE